MNITIFGTGYVGLVTGACFAEMGNQVLCVDVDAAKIAKLKRGELSIFEPGLGPLVRANHRAGRLAFTTDADCVIRAGGVIVIAVGTPGREDGAADLQHVLAVASTIGEHICEHTIVLDKSTVPVGTRIVSGRPLSPPWPSEGWTFRSPWSPTRSSSKKVRAVADFMRPDRIIIGSDDVYAAGVVERLYAPFIRNHDRVLKMDVRSAELTKYAANVMLATRISLMNEFANLAERLGADIEAVRHGVGSDPRIGHHFSYAGCGYGGSCFPKDVRAVMHMAEEVGYDMEITRHVEAVNERQKTALVKKMADYFGGSLAGRTLALWGLAFKPNTDDMREAPSHAIMEALWDAGAGVRAYDPQALDTARRRYGDRSDLVLCENREDTLVDADALAVVTEWNEFRSPDFGAIKAALKHAAVFDGRNLYDPALLADLGFDHIAIGRGNIAARHG